LAALIYAARQAYHFRTWARSPQGTLILVFVAAAGWMGVIATRPLTPVLSSGSYVSYLIPFMALALGALAGPALERLPTGQWRALISLLLVSLPGAIVLEGWLSARLKDWGTRNGGLVVLAGLLAALGLVVMRRADFSALAGALLIYALINPFGPSPDTALFIPDAAARRDTFLRVVAAVRSIDAAWPGQQPWLWFNYQEDPAYEMAACALAACHRNVISREFPAFRVAGQDKSSATLLVPGRPVVLLGRPGGIATLISDAVGSQVTAPVEQFTRAITAGQNPFTLYFLREPERDWQVSLPPAAWLSFQPQAAITQADGSFLSAPSLTQPGFMAFGPYINLPPGEYTATFWLSSGPLAAAGNLARLDVAVADSAQSFTGNERLLHSADFVTDGSAQPFTLAFTTGSSSNALEFRVLSMAVTRLTLSRVEVKWVGAYPSLWRAAR
jgi:hypothetical protein